MAFSGVYASNESKIEIKTASMASFAEIAEMTNFDDSVDTNTETWYSYGNDGFQSSLVTGHAFSFKITAKRCVGDEANDALAELADAIGQKAYVDVKITAPDGTAKTYNCSAAVESLPGGDATDVAEIEATFSSNGKPKDSATTTA